MLPEKITEFRESDDSESSSDEEYFTLEDHNLFEPSQKQQVCTKGDNCSQATKLNRSAYDEMSPPRQGERKIYRKEMAKELRRDRRGCSHNKAIHLPTLANNPGCRSQHQTSYQSPSQVNAQGFSSHNQVQGAEKKSEPADTRLRDTRGCSHYQSIYQHSLANSPGCRSQQQASYQSPSQANVQGYPSHNQGQGRRGDNSRTATKEYVEQRMPQRNQEMGHRREEDMKGHTDK
ncbi:hypothetical protein OS493_019174 [Desmophyllum pertusum]|uniref:Uncharacterized protein n=1 Tax=Desmophyllum pertusum TaxID=174260 RepID=A0A9W9YBV6_9CNID|nr:hypothetical protein OS493_019174 [Desmophyllum pertusum]